MTAGFQKHSLGGSMNLWQDVAAGRCWLVVLLALTVACRCLLFVTVIIMHMEFQQSKKIKKTLW